MIHIALVAQGSHPLDSWVFTALFSACAANNSPELRVVVTEASVALDRHWKASLSDRPPPMPALRSASIPPFRMFQEYQILQFCINIGVMHSALLASAMCCRGLSTSYNALLNACAKMGMMTAAEEVFSDMHEHGPPPDIITYNTMLAGYAQVASGVL